VKIDINFVFFNWVKWSKFLNFHDYDIADVAPLITSNEDAWVFQTYWQLATRGLNVTASSAPMPGRLNVVDGIGLPAKYFVPDLFCAGVRGDGHYPAFCQVVIHQNLIVQDNQPSVYIPQWPQPGVIPRDTGRRGVSTIGFLGHFGINLATGFKDPSFAACLKQLGCDFVVRGITTERVRWNDYSDIDLVLAVRDIPREHLLLKPVNKLTNAWIAGVPALMGPEPAIQAITESCLDYISVMEPKDVYCALGEFARNPDLYRKMVAHGRRRGIDFNDAAVAARWMEAIEEMKIEYSTWHKTTAASKMTDFERRLRSHHVHMARHNCEVHASYERMGFGKQWWTTRDKENSEQRQSTAENRPPIMREP
jgi:hypothetical protein